MLLTGKYNESIIGENKNTKKENNGDCGFSIDKELLKILRKYIYANNLASPEIFFRRTYFLNFSVYFYELFMLIF